MMVGFFWFFLRPHSNSLEKEVNVRFLDSQRKASEFG